MLLALCTKGCAILVRGSLTPYTNGYKKYLKILRLTSVKSISNKRENKIKQLPVHISISKDFILVTKVLASDLYELRRNIQINSPRLISGGRNTRGYLPEDSDCLGDKTSFLFSLLIPICNS